MEWFWSFFLWSSIIFSSTYLLLRHRRTTGHTSRLPPGPPGWPVFGHLFDLGTMPHHTLAGLKDKYGPVIWLRLGSLNTMVILNAKAATEFFKHHDLNFAERTVRELMKLHDYDKGSLALAPYGTFWRVLRRITTVEMIVAKRITQTIPIRRKCADNMISWIQADQEGQVGPHAVHVAHMVFLASFNMLGNLMLSRDLVDPKSKEGSEFFDAMMGLMEWTGHPNIADVFPCLGWLDLKGLRRNMDRDLGNALKIASGYVKVRVKEREAGGEKKNDFLDVMLDYEGTGNEEPAKISEHDLTIFILEIFLAGSETTSSSIEWAMTELLCSPDKMAKAKEELTKVVGVENKMEESDIENLPYLQAVVKEILRLHPPIPFLVPRKAIQDANFMGYNIPKNTQVFVNVWAIGRDPELWDEPLVFKPERFLDSNVEYKGQHFGFIPFGAGRRMCAGVPLAHRMLHLLLGSLLHEFDWQLDEKLSAQNMDRHERMGITVRKYEPLKAVPIKSTMP